MKKIQKLFSRQARTGLLLGIFVFQTILPFGIHTKETTVTAAELLDTPELQKLAETRPDLTTSHTENLLEKIKNQPTEVTETISEISGQAEVSDLTELKDLQNKAFKKAKKVKAEQKEREEENENSDGEEAQADKHESAADELTPDSEKTFDAETATEEELIEKLEEAGIIQTDETEDGETILVDPTLEETGIFTKTLKTNSTAHEIEIPLKNPAKAKITNEVEDTEFTLEFEPFYANEVEASYADNKVLSKNIFKETDLLQTTTKDGIKEDLILKNEAAPTSFLYSLDSNLTPRLSPRGELQMIDQRGVARFTSPKPIVYDAEGKQETAEYKLLTKSEAEEWLTTNNPNLLTVTNLTQTTDGWTYEETEPTPTTEEVITELLDETEEQAETLAEEVNDEEYIDSESASSSEETNDEEDIEIENNSATLNEAEEQPEDSSVTPLPQNDNSTEENLTGEPAETETTSFLQTLHNLLIPEAIADDEVEEENDPVILSEAKNLEDEQTEEASNEEVLATEEPTLEEEVQSEEDNSVILNEVKNLEEQQPEDSSVASLSQNDNSEEEISNEEEPLDEAHQLLETLKDTTDTQLSEIRTQLSLTLDDLDFYHEELETAEDEKRITQLNNLIKEAEEKKAELIQHARQEQNSNPTITNQNGEVIHKGTHAAAPTQTKPTESLFLLVYIPETTLTNLTYPLDLDPTVVTSSTYEIANSALFDGFDDYLSWTPASAGDRKKWSFNFSLKRDASNAGYEEIFGTRVDSNNNFYIGLYGNSLHVRGKTGGVVTMERRTAALFLDPTGFVNVLVVIDTAAASQEDRCIIYIDGVRQTDAYTTAPAQNIEFTQNSNTKHSIFANPNGGSTSGGYLSDVHFLDGQALDASTFGEEINNRWMPRAYEGNYGTNGFHLDFSNSGSLGEDSSGNNNDFTVNGAPTQTIDTPTNNFATWNPLRSYYQASFSNGNLSATGDGAGYGYAGTTLLASKFKSYVELTNVGDASSPASSIVGVSGWADDKAGPVITNEYIDYYYNGGIRANGAWIDTVDAWGDGDTISVLVNPDAGEVTFHLNGVAQGTYSLPVDDVYVFALARGTNTITMNAGATPFDYSPPAGFSALSTANLPNPTIADTSYYADVVLREGTGDNDLTSPGYAIYNGTIYPDPAYSASKAFDDSSGSNAHWQAGNAPNGTYIGQAFPTAQTIKDMAIWQGHLNDAAHPWYGTSSVYVDYSDNNFSTYTRLGPFSLPNYNQHNVKDSIALGDNGAHLYWRIVKNANTIQGGWSIFEIAMYNEESTAVILPNMTSGPDLVIIKNRDQTDSWKWTDSVRGATKVISSNLTDAETVDSDGLKSFNADGYSIGLGSDGYNNSGENFLELALKEDPTAGFDIVTYTGDGVAGRQILHDLGKAPTFMIVKRLDLASNWAVYHKDILHAVYYDTNSHPPRLFLNLTSSEQYDGIPHFDTYPTSSVFSLGINSETNASGGSYIAYLFTDSDVYKSFSYTGNGSADGPFVNLGGKPLSIPFARNTDRAASWFNLDTERNPFNPVDLSVTPNQSGVEATANYINIVSQGFKVINDTVRFNASGETHIGLAILDHGIKPPFSANSAPSAPTLISPANASTTNDTTPTLSARYLDSDSGDVGTVNYRVATTSAGCLNNSTVVKSGTSAETADEDENTVWTPSTSVGSDGTYYWCAQSDDGVAQSSWTSMGSFILDDTNPTIPAPTDEGAYKSLTSIIFTSTPSDGGSGLSDCVGQIDVNNTDGAGLVFNASVGSDGDHTFTGTNGNIYYYRYWCQDNAGNNSAWSSWTNGILVDTSAPTIPAPTDEGAYKNSTSITFTSTPSDGGSGLSNCWAQVDINNTDGASLAMGTTAIGADGDHTFTGSNGNTYYYRYYCRDNAGTNSSWSSWTNGILVDTSAPTIPAPTDEGAYKSSTSITFTSTPSDGGSGLSDCVGQIDVNNTDGAGLVFNASVGSDGDHTFTGTNGNTYYYRYYCSDLSGNNSSWSSWSDGILVDTAPPTSPVVTAASPTIDTTPTWSWSASGGGNGTFRYKLDSSDLTSGATTTTATSYTPGSALTAGNHTLYVQERDAAGNWSVSGSKVVSINTTPLAPTLVSPADGSTTGDNTPTLSATYEDDNVGDVGTVNYRVATTQAGCLDNSTVVANGTSAVTADESETTTWTPGGSIGASGTYYWCAQSDDEVVQSVWTSMGSFDLDTTGPTITVTSPNGGEDWSAHETHDITWTATDISGVESNSITIAYSTNGTDWTEIANSEANDGTHTWTPPNTTNSNYQIRITAEDVFGNSNSDSSDAVFSMTAADDWQNVVIINGNSQIAAQPDEVLATELQVRVDNGFGNYADVDEATVTFDITSVPTTPIATGQTLTAGTNGTATPVDSDTITVTTDASGYASATFQMGDRAGTYQVTATVGDGTGNKTATFTLIQNEYFDFQITEDNASLSLSPGNTANDTLNLTVTTNAASYELTNTLNQLPKNGTYQLNSWSDLANKFGWEWNSSSVTNDFAAATTPVTIFTCDTGDDCRGTKNYTVDIHSDINYNLIAGAYTSTLTAEAANIDYNNQTPNTFTIPATSTSTSTLTTSDPVMPTGYDVATTVAVTGEGSPQISCAGGAYSDSCTLNPTESFTVQLTSSAIEDATATATVTMDGRAADWVVTTDLSLVATGGTITQFGDYKIHAFTSSGIFSVEEVPADAVIDVLLVAGGGAAGVDDGTSGGGGAGGVVWEQGYSIVAGDYDLTVGLGGAQGTSFGSGSNGDNTSGLGFTAIGGGGGAGGSGHITLAGNSGGSGGGGKWGPVGSSTSSALQPGSVSGGLGNGGGGGYIQSLAHGGGGGGGASQHGQTGTAEYGGYGGQGVDMSVFFGTTYGENGWFAGGGGGGCMVPYGGLYAGAGGLGGGGDGTTTSGSHGGNGQANTGGGGGGAYSGWYGGAGGSGIVLIRYYSPAE